jgi:hypothetical protein
LAAIWGVSIKEAMERAEKLRDIGCFERRGTRDAYTFWVPFIYRNALSMIQGKADEDD